MASRDPRMYCKCILGNRPCDACFEIRKACCCKWKEPCYLCWIGRKCYCDRNDMCNACIKFLAQRWYWLNHQALCLCVNGRVVCDYCEYRMAFILINTEKMDRYFSSLPTESIAWARENHIISQFLCIHDLLISLLFE